jgi:hypothetical protein
MTRFERIHCRRPLIMAGLLASSVLAGGIAWTAAGAATTAAPAALSLPPVAS